ncbi:hypothetical protein C1H21_10510 [Xanthomonas arboricola pv. juglandis]|nr:hypothetical protein C1H21_10510 [Xanthomonas arboricola pv. juglandis]
MLSAAGSQCACCNLQQADGIAAAMDAARGLQSSVDVIGDTGQDNADGAQKKRWLQQPLRPP